MSNAAATIIKNVKYVIIPNSGGKKGIEYAAILGALVAKPGQGTRIAERRVSADRIRARSFMKRGLCTVELLPEV
jgi:L-cysteine desulfidase